MFLLSQKYIKKILFPYMAYEIIINDKSGMFLSLNDFSFFSRDLQIFPLPVLFSFNIFS